MNLPGGTIRTDPNNTQFRIGVVNDSEDQFSLSSVRGNESTCTHEVFDISWQLTDRTATALDSAALPPKAPKLAAWQDNDLYIRGDTFSDLLLIHARVTSATTIK